MGVFKTEIKNDDAYVNGIGRFDIELNQANNQVTWQQSEWRPCKELGV